MVSRHDVVLWSIPASVAVGVGVGQVTGATLATVAGLLCALGIVGRELFVVGTPE